ncbi:Synapsin [Clonorchis sinensis]|uniref:Synapsin n=1 Tax=Clonorchis sinensis TaxID=79923 RepID=A0A8T1MKX1_CLOSI|nr:Synapsin [Clonorchis sinensis]
MEMITFLKRRFSSGDLQGEAADKREQEGLPSFLRFGTTAPSGPQAQPNQTFQSNSIQQQTPYRTPDQSVPAAGPPTNAVSQIPPATNRPSQGQYTRTGTTDESSTNVARGRGAYPSAPTSPTRSYGGSGSFMGPMSNITGHISSTIMRGFSTAASTAHSMAAGRSTSTKEKQKVLLVIDDSQTDWCKYFKGRKLLGDWDLRVEQANFSEITMTAYSERGCVINIYQGLNQTKPVRSFKPDFVLLRQHSSGANEDWQPILTGLMYAGTPCMNTLHAVYNMKNRPWLFAHLLLLRNRLGKEAFPLITQVYHTSHKEMVTAPAFPTIIKIGLGHGGEGKIRTDNLVAYQDVTSLLAAGKSYATTEPFIDAKCDVHVQKIGPQYKAFVRKSISGHWKSNTGSSILEKVPMNERFKQWVDEVARMFGGLDICSVEALQSKTGEYFIYDVNGSDMNLFGESQEEDRREIAELVVQRMQTVCTQNSLTKASSLQSVSRAGEPERSQPAQPTVSTPMSQMSSTPIVPAQCPPMRQPSQPSQYQFQTHPSAVSASATGPFQPAGASMMGQPQSQPSSMQPPFHSGSSVTTTPHQLSSSTPFNPPASWGDQSSISSVSSSGGSVASMFTGISNKLDGILPSGQSTPTAVTGYHDSRPHDSAFPSRQSTLQSGTSISGSSGFNVSATTAWNATSSSGFEDAFGMMKNAELERPQQKNLFDSNDPFDRLASERAATSTFDGLNDNRGPPISSTQNQDALVSDKPFVPPRQTSLRRGSGAEDTDDTMKNLRKTFAGIFGDM